MDGEDENFIIEKVIIIRLLLGRPCWILTNYKSSPKCPAGQPVEMHARSAVCAASQIICITIENSLFKDLKNIKVTFDLDFDLASHK